MADDGRFPLELADGVDIVLRHLLDALVGEDLRIAIGRLDGLRVIGPHRRERCVALLFKQRTPAVPTAGEEPEAVDEHDRLQSRGVGTVDFLLFMGRKNYHILLLWVCLLGPSVRCSRSLILGSLAWLIQALVENPSRSQAVARAIAPRAAALVARAFNMTKSWMVPWNRTAVTRTAASRSLLAYASPSSRSTSASAVMTSAGGSPFNCSVLARSGEAVIWLRSPGLRVY